MEERKNNLLKYIIEEHIKTAAPVSSSCIAEKYFPELSSATIRNEMAELEEAGYIVQPHTSAGRIPTLLGFKHYAENLEADEKLSAKDENNLEGLDLSGDRENIKALAKKLAEMSSDAVVVGFGPLDVYYTGLSNLFSQPEFENYRLVYSMSQVIDGLDRVMSEIFNVTAFEPEVLIGANNPFGDQAATILCRCSFAGDELVLGILGLARMDYRRNLSLMKRAQELLKQSN